MRCLPQSQAERLLVSGLLALAAHLAIYVLLLALPAAQQSQLALSVSLAPAQAAPPAALSPPAMAAADALPGGQASGPAAPSPASPATPAGPAQPSGSAAPALAMARYYTAAELDTLAIPTEPIHLPEAEDELPQDLQLEVYIDYTGAVQRVVLPAGLPASYGAELSRRFQQAHFFPAQKDGMAVNSVKRIQLLPESL